MVINEGTPGRKGTPYKDGDCLVKRLTRSVTDENARRTYPNNQSSPDQSRSAHLSCQNMRSVRLYMFWNRKSQENVRIIIHESH